MRRDDPADDELAAHVRPPGWENPRPRGRYNLVVIGGGTAGLVAAVGAAGLGARVALVERDRLGGDCLNTGCVPSKALIAIARAAAAAPPADPAAAFAAALARVRAVRAAVAEHDSAHRLRDLGVDVYFGAARFTGRDRVAVGDAELRFARACIATGARPAVPPIEGLREAGYLTSDSVFDLDELPRRLAIVGGGPIGCELAQAFARLGSKVALVEAADRLLPRDDPDAGGIVARALQRDGVRVLVGAPVDRVEPARTLVAGGQRLRVDAILVATGRAPNVEDLDLAAAGIAIGPHGVAVDDRLRTANRRVYAAGDCCSPLRYTHAADAMARIVLRNALFFGRARASRLVVPWATYTDPEVAGVGLTAADAESRGIAAVVYDVAMAEVDRARTDGATDGLLRVVTRRGSDRILGATAVSPVAGETIAAVAFAMAHGRGLADFGHAIAPYPTYARALGRAADAYQRARLTPRVARWLAWLLRRRR